jgi:hypothetical protein
VPRLSTLAHLMISSRCTLALFVMTSLTIADSVSSQRGRRPEVPPEVKERWGNYFTTISIKTGAQNNIVSDLAKTDHVKNAAAEKHLSLIYFYDSSDDTKKREAFEQNIFNHNKINPGLRLFRCGRVDLANNLPARKKLVKVVPTFVVFGKTGEKIAQVPMERYKVVPAKLVRILKVATIGYNRPGWDNWVREYGKFVRDTKNMIAHQKILAAKRVRIGDRVDSSAKTTLEKVEVDERKLKRKMAAHYEREKRLLERAKGPEREPDAVLVGEQKRRRR